MSASNVKFIYDKKNKDGTSNFFSFDAKLEKSISDDYGYTANRVCNTCSGKIEQANVCTACGTVYLSDRKEAILRKKLEIFNGMKTYIGKITGRKDEKSEIVYDEDTRKQFVERETLKEVKVLEEIEADGLLKYAERFEKPFELYANEPSNSSVLLKIYGYLNKYGKALVCTFGINGGKSNKLGGLIVAGHNKLLLMQLLDHRLVRPTKQEGMTTTETDLKILDEVSANQYPELFQKFLDLVASGEKIEVAERPQKKEAEVIAELSCFD